MSNESGRLSGISILGFPPKPGAVWACQPGQMKGRVFYYHTITLMVDGAEQLGRLLNSWSVDLRRDEMRSARDKWLDKLATNKALTDEDLEAAMKVYIHFSAKAAKEFEKRFSK